MTWSEDAARSLAQTWRALRTRAVTAAACTDETGTAVAVRPGGTPADGRFENGSVTKTMTAALLGAVGQAAGADNPDRLGDELSDIFAGADRGHRERNKHEITLAVPARRAWPARPRGGPPGHGRARRPYRIRVST
jgi:hypothetical protein